MHHDLAILGAGLGGSITTLVAKQMGLNPILIERGKHPRFAIGESATPQADIALASIAETYNLDQASVCSNSSVGKHWSSKPKVESPFAQLLIYTQPTF